MTRMKMDGYNWEAGRRRTDYEPRWRANPSSMAPSWRGDENGGLGPNPKTHATWSSDWRWVKAVRMAPAAEQVRRKLRAWVQRKRKLIAALARRPGTRLVKLSSRLPMSQRGTSDRVRQKARSETTVMARRAPPCHSIGFKQPERKRSPAVSRNLGGDGTDNSCGLIGYLGGSLAPCVRSEQYRRGNHEAAL